MEKERLQKLLQGKTITQADLSHGTVKLIFSDGTSFEREKTCDGEIVATLFQSDQTTIVSCKIWP